MDVTNFIVSKRNEALLVGDYGSYRSTLSKRLLTLRRKLGRTSAKGKKYVGKAPITAEDVSSNPEFIQLQLLTAERAWAHAMFMKSTHSAESDKAITGSTRTHILSRIQKARKAATGLVHILADSTSSVSSNVLLEAQAYQSMLSGALEFESRKWATCLRDYSACHIIYRALSESENSSQNEMFQELLSSTIEPSIRYAAYQQKLPRTMPISSIVVQYAPRNAESIQAVLKLDPNALTDKTSEAKTETGQKAELPKTITWRSRTVPLEDASIAQALAAVQDAETKLAQFFSSGARISSKEQVVAYDEVLAPSQDAVDATKTAIDELTADGVSPADKRLQALQVTRTALNYALIGWRVGRNRALCGSSDGVSLEPEDLPERKKNKSRQETTTGSKMARLRERVVLYDSTIQSLDSVKELPGVAADQTLGQELDSRRAYFVALRSLALAHSHALLDQPKNALALFASALSTVSSIKHVDQAPPKEKTLSVEVTAEHANALKRLLQGLVTQQRALVEIHNLHTEAVTTEKAKGPGSIPFIERLDEFPIGGVNLTELVDYPPRLKPIPVKPIFLDVAWNYIDYPGRSKAGTAAEEARLPAQEVQEERKEVKKGWWGFGR